MVVLTANERKWLCSPFPGLDCGFSLSPEFDPFCIVPVIAGVPVIAVLADDIFTAHSVQLRRELRKWGARELIRDRFRRCLCRSARPGSDTERSSLMLAFTRGAVPASALPESCGRKIGS